MFTLLFVTLFECVLKSVIQFLMFGCIRNAKPFASRLFSVLPISYIQYPPLISGNPAPFL